MKLAHIFSLLLLLTHGAQVVADCGTAFALCEDSSPMCFIGDSLLPSTGNAARDAGRWGWRHGAISGEFGTITCDLWAGASFCNINDLSKKAGTATITSTGLTVDLDGWEFNPDPTKAAIHFYHGNNPYPFDNQGGYTVAPGQFSTPGYSKTPDYSPGTWDFVDGDLQSGQYFILHANVCPGVSQ